MKASITQLLKYELVEIIKANVFPTYANTYVGIGRPVRWGSDDTETANEIEDVVFTTDSRNQLFRDLMMIKKVAAADTAIVAPRVDWVTGTFYDEYSDHEELYSYTDKYTLTGTANASANIVFANTAVFTGNLALGDIFTLNNETRQVVAVPNTSARVVNAAFTYAVTDGTIVRLTDTYPQYANNFYCRNSKDQVFKCLLNKSNVASTIEPTIDIDGQLPENPYIQTSDGYRWKYLYTIPTGLKQKFFTNNWMPVTTDNAVVVGSVDGRIDILKIRDGGTGYFLDNGELGNSNSLAIITITGDGTGAEVTAKVESGVITDVNILNGGSGYTYANVVISDPDQLSSGNTANIEVVISPPGGHGSNPFKELGCYSIMTTVTLSDTESGTLPVGTDVYPFDFRQISLIRDPLLANSDYANASVYRTTTKLSMTSTGGSNYLPDEVVYSGGSLEDATLTAIVVNWDSANNELFINNVRGTPSVGTTLVGSTATAAILGVEEPDIELFTGDALYIENRAKIVRDADQTEQIRLVLSF
jgi:hypothetical protein